MSLTPGRARTALWRRPGLGCCLGCGANYHSSNGISINSGTTGVSVTGRPRPRQQRTVARRTYATNNKNKNGEIAVLGGGLTGLTTAYYLAKRLPATAKITLYEATERLGGWVRTEKFDVDLAGAKGQVSFERGPRTLSSLHSSAWRFDDLVLYDLALDLGLATHTPPDQPRYVYYPDHLVAMPPASSMAEFAREPLFLQSFWAGVGFVWRRLASSSRSVPIKDMSVAEWLHDITGSHSVADNLASAMVHGIYGGDVDRLSARSVLDRMYWAYYLPSMGPNVRQMTQREQTLMTELSADPQIQRLAMRARGSLLHFGPDGMESLPRALEHALQSQPNVEIKRSAAVADVSYDGDQSKVQVRYTLALTKHPPPS